MPKKVLKIANLEVEVTYKKGMKNIYLRVDEKGVRVSAPPRTPNYIVERLITDNLEEIITRLKKITKLNYNTDDEIFLFGKKYKLKIIENQQKDIKILEDKIIMSVPKKFTVEDRKNYFRNYSREQLLKYVKYFINQYKGKMQVTVNEVRIKNMKTRWGTCNITKKRIWINEQLAKYPLECIEHVVVHELVHLLETNHTKRFYSLVENYYPQYQESEALLKTFSQKINYV